MILHSAAANTPRIAYNPDTGDLLGVMCEGSGTNKLTTPNDFTSAAWVNEGHVTIEAAAATGPDGEMSMTKMTALDTNNPHIWNNDYILADPAPDVVAGRIWLLAGSVNTFRVRCNQAGAGTSPESYGRIVSGPGSIKSQGTSDGSVIVENLSDSDLTLLEFWTGQPLTPSANFVTSLHFDYNSAGDWNPGDSILFGFEQLQEDWGGSSWMGTGGTRDADSIQYPIVGIPDTDVTWLFEGALDFPASMYVGSHYLWMNGYDPSQNGGTTTRWSAYLSSGNIVVQIVIGGSIYKAFVPAGSIESRTIFRLAAYMGYGQIAASLNGGPKYTQSYPTEPVGLSAGFAGSQLGTTNHLRGYIRGLGWYKGLMDVQAKSTV